jgi:hypothetical protein
MFFNLRTIVNLPSGAQERDDFSWSCSAVLLVGILRFLLGRRNRHFGLFYAMVRSTIISRMASKEFV